METESNENALNCNREQRYKHSLYHDCSFTFAAFANVKNAQEVRHAIIGEQFDATLLKSSMIISEFQLLTAVHKAVFHQRSGRQRTRNLHTEVLYCLSPNKNISDSFRKFGMADEDTSVVVVFINDTDDCNLQKVQNCIVGEQVPLSDITCDLDLALVKKVYKVTDLELTVCSLEDAIVSRIASKELVVA